MPQISRDKQCKDEDAIEGQAINELSGLFQSIAELKASKLGQNRGVDYEN